MIGHERLIEDFKRLAKEGRLSHAYLFFGPPRVGKATFARAFANFLENGVFEVTKSPQPILGDAWFAAPDEEKTIGVDRVREIRNFLFRAPNRSSVRTAVVDGGEWLTTEAQNALLKITEEPPPRSLVILVLQDPEALWPTLRSRLQRVYFPPVPVPVIEEWLVRELRCPPSKARAYARESSGAPGFAHAIVRDERFGKVLAQADEFLRMNAGESRDFLKDLVDDEKFDADAFLEALMLRALPRAKRPPSFWHALFALRRDFQSFNVNPRLQLTALWKRI